MRASELAHAAASLAAAAVIGALLAGCGGGGQSVAVTGVPTASTPPPPANPPPPNPLPPAAATNDWAVAVLASRAVALSADRKTLGIEYEIAVLRPDGSVLENLTANDFAMTQQACGDWYNCIEDDNFRNIGDTQVATTADEVTLLPAQVRSPYAAAILIDLGAEPLVSVDRDRKTIAAAKQFVGAVTHADHLALATFQGPGTPSIATGFTTDTASVSNLIDLLPGQERDASPLNGATEFMLAFVANSAPASLPATQKVLVVPAWNHRRTECGGDSMNNCLPTTQALRAAARASGVRLVAIGSTSVNGAALLSGGVSIELSGVHQLPAAARSLDAIVSRSLPRHRVRMTLRATSGSFAAGSTAVVLLRVRIAADDTREVWGLVPVTL
jgi:hypothetical protein